MSLPIFLLAVLSSLPQSSLEHDLSSPVPSKGW